MKRVNIIVGILVVVVIGLLSFLPSRKEPRPTYAAATETRIEGTVVEVQEFYCPVTEDRGTHLVVKTAAGPVLVHVGVARALRAHNISFAPGDRIEVAGSKVRFNGAESVIAREIDRGNEIFTLRDTNGQPRLSD